MRATSSKYKGLRVAVGDGSVKFVDGEAEVSMAQAAALRKLPASFGVTVVGELPEPDPSGDGGASDDTPPPVDNEHVADGAELFEPKGNASVEEWRAYAVQKGHEAETVADLKREDIKALFTE